MATEETKHIFVDTNIFLDFYRLSEKDINELRKIIDSIKNGSIKLYISKQVKQEFLRERESVFSETFKKINNLHPDHSLVALFEKNNLLKKYDLYPTLKKAKQIIEKIKSELIDVLQKDILNKELLADKLIDDIFNEVEIFDSDKYLNDAISRMKFGNPPGKKNSFGDAINWLFLLENVPDNIDLIIISHDSDYESLMNQSEIKSFLQEEWNDKKKSKVYLYDSLSSFFNKHDLKIELEEKLYKDEMIERLKNSPNFLSTHAIISRLSVFNFFEDYQIINLANALFQNPQVSWIIGDNDVKEFYKKHLSDRFDLFNDEEQSLLDSYLQIQDNSINKELDKVIKKISSIRE